MDSVKSDAVSRTIEAINLSNYVLGGGIVELSEHQSLIEGPGSSSIFEMLNAAARVSQETKKSSTLK